MFEIEPTYDTKEEAIERAKQMLVWQGDGDDHIFVHREWVPLWFAHIVRETCLQWLAYTEHK